MTEAWTAPHVKRTEPGLVLGERQVLEAWLDFHRDTLLLQCAGLTAGQLKERAAAAPGAQQQDRPRRAGRDGRDGPAGPRRHILDRRLVLVDKNPEPAAVVLRPPCADLGDQ
jgi:hypothetical protein